MTPDEAAEILDVTSRTVRRWCEQGHLPAKQTVTGRWRIYGTRTQLEAFIRARPVIRKSPPVAAVLTVALRMVGV